MLLTKDGKGTAKIILPENPTSREKYAAEELISYVKKISGAELSEGDARIIIGGPERNRAARELISEKEFDREVPGPEGFMIMAKGNDLLIAGSSKNVGEKERGTVYAVYELLERYLGCSLSAYSNHAVNAGELIPESSDIEIPDVKYVKSAADLPYRTAIVQYSSWRGNPDHELNVPFISWLVKNRFNRILTWVSVYEGYKKNGMLEEAEKRGISFSVGHHESTALFLPPDGNDYFPEKYYETHPEYYRLDADGTRYYMAEGKFGGQLIQCLRHREGTKTYAKNVIAWLDKNPDVDVVCLWPNDGKAPQCCCEKCRKYTKTQNYTYFVSKVANAVKRAHPHVKIDQIAYVDLFDCDVKKTAKNVIIDQTTWHTIGLRGVGRPDGSCLNHTLFEKTALSWKKAGAEVVYYDYMMATFGAVQRWMPMAEEMQAICRRMKEVGISGLGTQMEVFNNWNHILNFYTFGRTAYDNSISFEDSLDSFSKIFGKGGEFIKEIVRLGEKHISGQTSIGYAGKELIEQTDCDVFFDLYEKALEAAETKLFRNNVRLMRMGFRYSFLEVTNKKDKKYLGSNKTGAIDETGELTYMMNNFDSFVSGKEGYGIAIPVGHPVDTVFEPNYWYEFE